MTHSKVLDNRLKRILSAVTKKVQEHVDLIDPVFKFRAGIEGWFKVELVAALNDLNEEVVNLKNKGPDIILSDNLQIELKGATDFNPSYLRDGALKDGVPCLFLGSGENIKAIGKLKSMEQIQLIGLEYVKGIHTWAVGCIVPTTYKKGLTNKKKRQPSEPKINNKPNHSLMENLDESKYSIQDIFEKKKASNFVKAITETFHNEVTQNLTNYNLVFIARTNSAGITYFCTDKKAFMFADIKQEFLSCKFFTGTSKISGLIKGNWEQGENNHGSKTFRIEHDETLKIAISFAIKAYKIALNWTK